MDARQMKIRAAEAALAYVEDGMRLGIGTGSTAEEFVRLLAERVADGLSVRGVPTSERTARLCLELGIPLYSLDEEPELDLTIDGADEVDHQLRLIKGGGGALLREKIVAAASGQMVVIADESKLVDMLGAFPLPIEVNPFGTDGDAHRRREGGRAARPVGIDRRCAPAMPDPSRPTADTSSWMRLLAVFLMQKRFREALHLIPGVVEHGLFLSMTSAAIIAGTDGVRTLAN